MFTGVRADFVVTEQSDLVTECKIEWSKVKMKNNKDLYICSFYMPNRNMQDLLKRPQCR